MFTKYLLIAFLVLNSSSLLSMEYIREYATELKNNAQDFWANANLFTKTAVVGVTAYVFWGELRNKWNKARIRKLEEKVVENSTKTNETLHVVGAISGDLYDISPHTILYSFSLDENFIDGKTGEHIFKSQKYRNKFVKKTESAKNHYSRTFSTLFKKRNHVQFGSMEATGNSLAKNMSLHGQWLINITTALGVIPSGCVPNEPSIRDALHKKIATAINEKLVPLEESITTLERQTQTLNLTIFGDEYNTDFWREEEYYNSKYYEAHRELARKHLGTAHAVFGDTEKAD